METEIVLNNFMRVLQEYAERYRMVLKRNILENDNVATGDLFASIFTDIEIDGNVFKVEVEAMDYIKYLENGTKPHWPPPTAMLKWVRAKKLPTRNQFPGDKSLPTEKQLAYLVGRKISEEGTDARLNFARTNQELYQIYTDKLTEALAQDIIETLPIINLEIRS